ncbi:hypothetical protein [Streptomyces mirabilis]|uniref:hypothetical protein n=1 Tax=Streptomyces mirabilis TaxID=68239 RepID=UPI0033B6F867
MPVTTLAAHPITPNGFCAGIFRADRRFDLIPTRANGQPAFGAYLHSPNGISLGTGRYVLTLTGDRVCAMQC